MPRPLHDLEADLQRIDARLRPIAKGRADLTDPAWFEKMMGGGAPLDRAGVRQQAQDLLVALVKDYARADAEWRAAVRELLRRYDCFLWATPLPFDGKTPHGFRSHLVVYSMSDQEKDPRDAQLTLEELVRTARAAGIEAAPILREVAALSAETHPCGWRSTRQCLESAARGLSP